MTSHLANGHIFWKSQNDMLKNTKNQKIFIKNGTYTFSAFSDYEYFLEWFESYREICSSEQKEFEIYEMMRSGIDMCFAADVEVYVNPDLASGKKSKLINIIHDEFSRIYGKYGQSDNLIFMEDHRMSSAKLVRGGPEVPMFKISFHVLGKSELFNEMHNDCKMKQLAKHVDIELVASIKNKFPYFVKFSNDETALDMKIYSKNRAMRTILSQKKTSDGSLRPGFQLSECNKHMHFSDCFITQNVSDLGKKYFDYDFPVIDGVVQKNTKKPKYNNCRLEDSIERTPEHRQVEDLLRRHLVKTHGNGITVKFNGRVYELRGQRKTCFACHDSHSSNGAYIYDLGAGKFEYNCLAAERGNNVFFSVNTPKKSVNSKYLESFEYVKSKVISIDAPMGSGKTYQIEKFIEANYKDKNILFITCRRGMARSLKGRLDSYELYTDELNQRRQIQQYESLHKCKRNFYDLIVMDEIRSTLNSATCMETNKQNITTNMETLQEMFSYADQIICADADLSIDGTVSEFYKNTFEQTDLHHIVHSTGVAQLNHQFAGETKFVEMMQDDLKKNKKIMLCCGSATKLKAISLLAEEIVGADKTGIYYADCPKQKEIENVTEYWDKYKFIGFTSTITVSVDYQGPVDKVYIFPDSRTCSPRDMNQMRARARNITSKTVVVMYEGLQKNGPLKPLDFHLQSAKDMEMNKIMTRRRLVTSYYTDVEKTIYGTIRKDGVGHKAKYYSSILTDLWAWSRVENVIKSNFWIQFFISIVSLKGHTYSKCGLFHSEEKFAEKTVEIKKVEQISREEKERIIESVSVEDMSESDYKELVDKKIKGDASIEDVAKIDKFQVQRLYDHNVNSDFVKSFNKNKRSIFNRSFLNAFPGVNLRKEIDLHRLILKASIDDFRLDTMHVFILLETLSKIGFGSAGSNVRIDMFNLPPEKLVFVEKCVEFIKRTDMSRSSTDNVIKKFQLHVANILGYTFTRHKMQKNNVKFSNYSLEDNLGPELLINKIFPEVWIDNHKDRVVRHSNLNDEYINTTHVDEFIESRNMKRMMEYNESVQNKKMKN